MSTPMIDSQLDPQTLQQLTQLAQQTARHAYAPYSKFHVGAAVLDEQGKMFAGCNVENASYGLTNCAERVAVGAAVASGSRKLQAVVIFTPTPALTPPCGACRQVLSEFGPHMEVHLINDQGGHHSYTLDQLLPAAFELEQD